MKQKNSMAGSVAPLLLASAVRSLANASIGVEAREHDGDASGTAYLYREYVWSEAGIKKREFRRRTYTDLNQGTVVFAVPPGHYRAQVQHQAPTVTVCLHIDFLWYYDSCSSAAQASRREIVDSHGCAWSPISYGMNTQIVSGRIGLLVAGSLLGFLLAEVIYHQYLLRTLEQYPPGRVFEAVDKTDVQSN